MSGGGEAIRQPLPNQKCEHVWKDISETDIKINQKCLVCQLERILNK